jgi:cyclopropane-fatty-acyl-phospholipid synthase
VNSLIYQGAVSHARLEPVEHTFRYPVYFLGLDLDELPELPRRLGLFGYNRFRLLALHDRDYLMPGPGTIKEKLWRVLEEHGLARDVTRAFLVTAGRFLNYVFNPVSFYYCYGAAGDLCCTVAEVNNTFGERHLYVLQQHLNGQAPARFQARKSFHVSPFNDLSGDYDFSFSAPAPALDIRVNIQKEGRIVFRSQLAGQGVPLTRGNLLKTVGRYPLAAALTFPRILVQAGHLYFRRRLPVHPKPPPSSDQTLQVARPRPMDRLARRVLQPLFTRLQRGSLELVEADGRRARYGGEAPGVNALVRVRDHAMWTRLMRDGDIGLGEAYMLGLWDSPSVTDVIRLFIDNREHLDDLDVVTAALGRIANRLLHVARPNTARGSRRNIGAHYDLSNDFFQLWLDPTLLYSSGIYASPDDTLEQAQLRKLHKLIGMARIGPQHHVLEIGSGWGAFALEAVRRTGCRVTSVTVSQRQLELAQQRAQAAGLADRITFELRDYRDLQGQYDRIVSIEMLEAVGHRYLGRFFSTCERVLKPDGLMALQVITIPDQRYDAYRKGVDWIQKHIFPGGHLPSLEAITRAMTASSRLVVEELDNIGIHYARTLREWRASFLARRDEVRKLGFDEIFLRKWDYYLCYCEAAFASRTLNNLHLLLTRPGNPALGVE